MNLSEHLNPAKGHGMPNFLSTQEQFQDRVELIGYLTLIASGALLIVYFGMLFFYAPVQQQSAGTKAGLLGLFLAAFAVGWWIPKHKNFARRLFLLFFLVLGTYSADLLFKQEKPWYALPGAYAFFGYWILSHPAAVRFFRPLKPAEARFEEGSQVFSIFRVFFLFQGAWAFYAGSVMVTLAAGDPLYNPAKAVGLLCWALLLWLILFLLKHGQPFARWTLAGLLALQAIMCIPDTFGKHSYIAYWSALGNFSLSLAYAIFLASSAWCRAFFKKDTPPAQPTAPTVP